MTRPAEESPDEYACLAESFRGVWGEAKIAAAIERKRARDKRHRPAESPVHPLPPTRWLPDLGGAWHLASDSSCDCRQCEVRRATTPPPVREIRRPWLLPAMLEDIYRGAWKLEDPELNAAIQAVAALANGQPIARLTLGVVAR